MWSSCFILPSASNTNLNLHAQQVLLTKTIKHLENTTSFILTSLYWNKTILDQVKHPYPVSVWSSRYCNNYQKKKKIETVDEMTRPTSSPQPILTGIWKSIPSVFRSMYEETTQKSSSWHAATTHYKDDKRQAPIELPGGCWEAKPKLTD